MLGQICKLNKKKMIIFLIIFFVVLICAFVYPYLFPQKTQNYFSLNEENTASVVLSNSNISHIEPPSAVKAIYMTSWVASTPSLRSKLVDLIKTTEINSIVIDIKNYDGKVAFEVNNPKITKYNSVEVRIKNIEDFLEELHNNNIYIIGRISAFQDSHLVKVKPEWAVKKESLKSEIWRDRKGIAWLDAGSKDVWRYLADIGHYAYSIGFDELNFDYLRFPSDGNMKDIYFPYSEGKEKREVIRKFFGFLYKEFRDSRAVISADLFGMTTTNTDDLNIGQYLEYALPYFDYVAPMVYPSHYPAGFIGLASPASEPYRVVRYSLDEAFKRASTTPNKIRPWLQDFDLGADYDAKMVRAQIQATYDAGFNSFMIWSPSNRYTKEALNKP